MGNGRGTVSYMNSVLQYLFPAGFQSIGFATMGTEFSVEILTAWRDFWVSVGQTQLYPVYTALIEQAQQATKDHTLSPSMNDCTGSLFYPPARDAAGNNLAFTKPILLVTDNFTASAGEFFSANLQDNGRAFVYGARTIGAGGSVREYIHNATPYSEGTARLTESL